MSHAKAWKISSTIMSSNWSLYANDSQSCFSGTPEEYIHSSPWSHLSVQFANIYMLDNVQIDFQPWLLSSMIQNTSSTIYQAFLPQMIKGPLRLNLFKIKPHYFTPSKTRSSYVWLIHLANIYWAPIICCGPPPSKTRSCRLSLYPHNQSTSHVYSTSYSLNLIFSPTHCPAFSPALSKLSATTHSPVISILNSVSSFLNAFMAPHHPWI